jgi:hypothetical protein
MSSGPQLFALRVLPVAVAPGSALFHRSDVPRESAQKPATYDVPVRPSRDPKLLAKLPEGVRFND